MIPAFTKRRTFTHQGPSAVALLSQQLGSLAEDQLNLGFHLGSSTVPVCFPSTSGHVRAVETAAGSSTSSSTDPGSSEPAARRQQCSVPQHTFMLAPLMSLGRMCTGAQHRNPSMAMITHVAHQHQRGRNRRRRFRGGQQVHPQASVHHSSMEEDDENVFNSSSSGSSSSNQDISGPWLSIAGCTKQGYDRGGGKPHNQDRAFIIRPFRGQGQVLLGVLDGHGSFGHLVSAYLVKHLPSLLAPLLPPPTPAPDAQQHSTLRHPLQQQQQPQQQKQPTAPPAPGEPATGAVLAAFTDAFASADHMLAGSGINALDSGSTALVAHLSGRRLTTAWVGDSRAVLARQQSGGGWRAVQLSDDHKPERPDEQVRILLNGGRIDQMKDRRGRGVGPFRVWFPDMDYPGLAMSRAFGDLPCRRLGVLAVPEVAVCELGPHDRWLVLASDGVYEYMSNQQVVDVVAGSSSPEEAASRLVASAEQSWQAREGGGYIDDITAVVVQIGSNQRREHRQRPWQQLQEGPKAGQALAQQMQWSSSESD